MAAEDPKTARSGLSLYANLLNPDSNAATPGTISSAPVVYKQSQQNDAQQEPPTAEKSQISSAALRFQPTKRPQIASQKPKSKPPAQKPPPPPPPSTCSEKESTEQNGTAIRISAKTLTLADWTAEGEGDDVNGFYVAEKRQRGGRKKRKKNKQETHIPQNWDDIYDPSRPNVYEDYKNSDERIMEIREWKDRLYAHRITQRRSSDSDSDSNTGPPRFNQRFAPPPQIAAVPLPALEDFYEPSPPPPEPVAVPDDFTGEDVYLRRMRLAHQAPTRSCPSRGVFEPSTSPSPPPPPPNLSGPIPGIELDTERQASPPPAPVSRSSISRAPVRYNLPAPPPELPASEAELKNALNETNNAEEAPPSDQAAPRSLRPGQKGFAERLMSKYGWSKGSGLGASGSGITAPLRVQLEKQKKKSDSEGGGYAGPGGMGKIIGGKRKGGAETQEGKFGAMSEVIVLRGMLDGMNLDEELGAGNGGLMQEIGEECGEKYGRVERVYINRDGSAQASVFVKFTSQLSALRAVNALEGRVFNGNTITARFFEPEKFESGIYQ